MRGAMKNNMRATIIAIIILSFLLASCTQTADDERCAQECDQAVAEALGNAQAKQPATTMHCPFDVCFSPGTYYKEVYFSYKPIRSMIKDTDCNDEFEGLYNATTYHRYTKQAEPLTRTGRGDDGKDTWHWRIDCACSYQP